jgi:hypothetical protein
MRVSVSLGLPRAHHAVVATNHGKCAVYDINPATYWRPWLFYLPVTNDPDTKGRPNNAS